jgi:hypothetical protein
VLKFKRKFRHLKVKSLYGIIPNYLQLLKFGIFFTAAVATVVSVADEPAVVAAAAAAAVAAIAASMSTAATTVSHFLFNQQNDIEQ